ncbi:heparan-alpha-glucosaminide N-acetyltransferase [Pararhizobium sp. LjRoot238]|uniref:heparan-alpha-glucosaminide N-acetyltransferase n=1 Tax=Pararhizobium sp. LjRoot238 TaxID=3342293 RepID=UPI003ECD9B69
MSITNAVTASDNGEAPPATAEKRGRIWAIDALRGVALIAMATYHFSWDLEFFGYIEPGTVGTGAFKMYARLIAGSFLFLAGVSLVLGHYPAIRARAFAIRFAKIAAAALAITGVTWFVFPDSFIFFGILHSIATASLIGLIFLKLPALLTLAAAAAAFAAPLTLRSPVFDTPALLWVGLSETLPRSNDYVPLLPWLGPFLAGIAVARIASGFGWFDKLRTNGSARWKTVLTTAGRHSLIIYLLHQPLLFALVYLFSLGFPAAKPDPVEAFRANCEVTCSKQETAAICARFCGCTLDKLMEENLFEPLNAGKIDITTDERIARIASQCTVDAQAKE